LSKLPTVSNWNKYLDLVANRFIQRSIIREAQQKMSDKFPFRSKRESYEQSQLYPQINPIRPVESATQPNFNSHPNLIRNVGKDGSIHAVLPQYQQPQYVPNNPLQIPISANNTAQNVCRRQLSNAVENTIKLKEAANKHADLLRTNYKNTFESVQRISMIGKCLND